jgi:CRP-like cAMP-binding protein
VTELNERADLLAAVPLLDGIPADELENLAALAEPFSMASGEVLFEEGDPADVVYVVASGEVEFLKRLPGDRAVTASKMGPGTMFGEMAFLAGLPRVATARAVAPTAGLAIDARGAQALLGAPRTGRREFALRVKQEALSTLRMVVERIAERVSEDPRAHEPAPDRPGEPPPVAAVDPEPGELDYLRTILFFGNFDTAELEALFGGCRRLSAPRGAELIAEGDRPENLLIVTRGATESTVRRGAAAARVRLAGPGRIVTHLGVLDDGPCPTACRARERAILIEMPRARLEELVREESLLAARCLRTVYQDLVNAIVQADRPLSRMAAARP